MAITKILGLAHLPRGPVGDYKTGYGMAISDVPLTFTFASGQAADRSITTEITEKGNGFAVRRAGALTTTGQGLWRINFKDLFAEAPSGTIVKVIIGMRIAFAGGSALVAGQTVPVFALGSTAVTTVTNYIAATSLNTTADIDGYYEFVITPAPNASAGTVEIWRDGNLVSTTTGILYTAAKMMSEAQWVFGNANSFWSAVTATTVDIFTFSDIYTIVDTGVAGDTQISRLGPCQIDTVPVVSTDTANWSAPNGTLVGNLNKRQTVVTDGEVDGSIAGNLYPYVASDAANTPLKMKMDVSAVPVLNKIIAVQSAIKTYRDTGVTAGLETKWSYLGTSVRPKVLTVPLAAAIATVRSNAITAMPDGTAFTKAKLADLELVLTPS